MNTLLIHSASWHCDCWVESCHQAGSLSSFLSTFSSSSSSSSGFWIYPLLMKDKYLHCLSTSHLWPSPRHQIVIEIVDQVIDFVNPISIPVCEPLHPFKTVWWVTQASISWDPMSSSLKPPLRLPLKSFRAWRHPILDLQVSSGSYLLFMNSKPWST